MSRYDSHKHPFTYQMNQWSKKRTNDVSERQAKSIPCSVKKIDKDFIHVAFETQNGIFTPPVVKIPQSWSQYSREPTQVGDKGYAVPGNYYLGGVTGDSGGNTDFYPRGNLTTLSFNGVSHKQNPDRDYDQLTHMGGPNGWIVGSHKKQKQDQQQNQQQQNRLAGMGPTAFGSARGTDAFRAQQARMRTQLGLPATLAGETTSSGSGQSGQQGKGEEDNDKTNFSFDKEKKCLMQSVDEDHQVTVDQKAGKITLNVPTSKKVYVGGDGKKGKYAKIMTEDGPMINGWGRVS